MANPLLEYLLQNRGVGHTTACIEGVRRTQKAVLITHENGYAHEVSRKHNINAIPINALQSLQGTKCPIVVDNSALLKVLQTQQAQIDKNDFIIREFTKTTLGKRLLEDAERQYHRGYR